MYPQEYVKNRRDLPLTDLANYRGQWVAFSLDGRRIIAGNEDLARLDEMIVAAGEDPEKVAFEHIEADEVYLGGAELL